MSEYTMEELEEMNEQLAERESEAHNMRDDVLGLIKLKREGELSELSDEELDILMSNIEKIEEKL